MEDWFVSWFNTPYYHTLYQNRDETEAEAFVNRLVDYLDIKKPSKVLDLACGKGRHSKRLHDLGMDVIGIDLSDESIAEAKQNETDGLEFFVHDMRHLFWNEHFDAVFNLFTSFGYFHNSEDDQKTISSVADSLKSEGQLVIDFMNAVKVEDNLVLSEDKTIDGIRFEITREVNSGVIIKRIHVIDGDIELDFEEQVDALRLEHFQEYLRVAGLEIEDTFGNYQLEPFNEENSDRLIIVAKKPAA
ncbi:MAG: class I SAM-dependent methyltransferase [Flavobacteriales bacterium]